MSWDSGSTRQVTEKQTAEVVEQLEPTMIKVSGEVLNKSRQPGGEKELQEQPVLVLRLSLETSRSSGQG